MWHPIVICLCFVFCFVFILLLFLLFSILYTTKWRRLPEIAQWMERLWFRVPPKSFYSGDWFGFYWKFRASACLPSQDMRKLQPQLCFKITNKLKEPWTTGSKILGRLPTETTLKEKCFAKSLLCFKSDITWWFYNLYSKSIHVLSVGSVMHWRACFTSRPGLKTSRKRFKGCRFQSRQSHICTKIHFTKSLSSNSIVIQLNIKCLSVH